MLFYFICFVALQAALGVPIGDGSDVTADTSLVAETHAEQIPRLLNFNKLNPFYWISGDDDDLNHRVEKIEKRQHVLYELFNCVSSTSEHCKSVVKLATKLFKKKEDKPQPAKPVKPKPIPVPKPDKKPDPKPDVKPDPKPDTNPDVKPDPKPDTNPDVKPDPKPDTKPDVKPDPVTVKPDVQPTEAPQPIQTMAPVTNAPEITTMPAPAAP